MQARYGMTAHRSNSKRVEVRRTTALMQAVKDGLTETVYLLAEKESGCLDEKGDTALILAACLQNYDAISILAPLEAGIRGTGRQTALMHLSSLGCSSQILKLLASAEARLTDDKGWTALMFAALWGHIDAVSYLAEFEAGIQDQDGMTALMYAASKKRIDVVDYLLNNHAEKEACKRNNLGRTALMIAAILRDHESSMIVQKLVAKEAKLQDQDGMTALMLACLRGNSAALAILAKREVGILNKRGYCALNYCIESYKVTFYPYLVSELDLISRNNPYKQLCSRETLLIDLVFLSAHYKIAKLIKLWLCSIVEKLSNIVYSDSGTDSDPTTIDTSIYIYIELLFNYYLDGAPITIGDLLHSYDELLDITLNAHLHSTCSVCLDYPASAIYYPCRHMVVCSRCFEQNEKLRDKCVVCKSDTNSIIVVSLFEYK